MSSILDALNKLEEEQAVAQRERDRSAIDPAAAAADLVGRSVLRDRVTVRVAPGALLVAVLAGVAVLVAVSAIVSVLVLQSTTNEGSAGEGVVSIAAVASPVAIAAKAAPKEDSILMEAPAEPMPAETPVSEPVAATNPDPMEETIVPVSELPAPETNDRVAILGEEPEPVVSVPPPEPVRDSEPARASIPKPVASPLPDSISETPRLPDPPARERYARRRAGENWRTGRQTSPEPGEAVPAGPVALSSLPLLTSVEQSRYGFDRLTINMVKPASAVSPQGSAIITVREEARDGEMQVNRLPFYEGQRVQNSQLRIFRVESRAVGFEDVRTGARYHIPF